MLCVGTQEHILKKKEKKHTHTHTQSKPPFLSGEYTGKNWDLAVLNMQTGNKQWHHTDGIQYILVVLCK